MTRTENRARKAAQKIAEKIDNLPDAEELRPLIIKELLKSYDRYGLAALVEKGWNWLPERDDLKRVNEGVKI